MGYQVEEKELLEVFSVYYHDMDMLCIKYVSAYSQEEANASCTMSGLDVVYADMM